VKSTSRPPRQQARQQAATTLKASGNISGNAYVLHPGRAPRHGPRRWQKIEYAQEAITARYPNTLPDPEHVNFSALTKWVNKRLRGRYNVSRQTVMRALQVLRAANRAG
jgi:hypothetical protein